MKISVIIAAYNKPFHLERTIYGYSAQNDGNFELVITEDADNPEIAEVIKDVAPSTGMSITHLTQRDEGFRKTVALNRAIEAANGDYLIFTDDDCIPRKDVVAVHREYAQEGQYIVGAYNRLPISVSRSIQNDDVLSQRAFSLPWLMSKGYFPTRGFIRMIVPRKVGRIMDFRGPLSPGRFPGGHSSCFKADAVSIGGFNEKMSYGLEDREFGTRLYNKGIRGKRIKNSTFMLHLAHERPYHNMDEFHENLKILDETVKVNRIKAAHLDD